MGSCMSTPSEEPKHTPQSSKQNPPSSATATPVNNEVINGNPVSPTTAPNSATTPQSQAADNASGGMHDRGSDAQAISAALAATEGSIEKRGSKDRSNAIDRQLEDDQRKFKKECKILLLGKLSLCLTFVLEGVPITLVDIMSSVSLRPSRLCPHRPGISAD
jgi:guanine nucleotide-binding protein G(i) subunit alpha